MITPLYNIAYSSIFLSALLVVLSLPLVQCGKRPSLVEPHPQATNYPYPAPQNVPPTPTAPRVN